MMGETATTRVCASQGFSHALNSEDGSNRHDGIRGAHDHQVCLRDRGENTRGRRGLRYTRERHPGDLGCSALLDEVLLKIQRAPVGRRDDRAHFVVGHGKDARPHSQPAGELRRHFAQSRSRSQPDGAVETGSEVPVTEVEPGIEPEGAHALDHREGVALDAPALVGVGDARQPVSAYVEVGAHVHAIDDRVVTGVHDRRQIRAEPALQPDEQLCSSHPSGERGDLHPSSIGEGSKTKDRPKTGTKERQTPKTGRGSILVHKGPVDGRKRTNFGTPGANS